MKLDLARETLAEITAGDLANVAGGPAPTAYSCPASMPLDRCLGDPPTLPPNCYTLPC